MNDNYYLKYILHNIAKILITYIISNLLFFSYLAAYDNTHSQIFIESKEVKNIDNKLYLKDEVFITRGESKVIADEVIYDQDKSILYIKNNAKIFNYNDSNISFSDGYVTDNILYGEIHNPEIIFQDGSYIKSNKSYKINDDNILTNNIYSLCPDDDIKKNNQINNNSFIDDDYKSLIKIKSKKVILNREKDKITLQKSLVKLLDIPILYIPYLRMSFPSSGRKSGLLSPSYISDSKFGNTIEVPLYLNLKSYSDLTISPLYFPESDLLLLENEYRLLTKYGQFNLNLNTANHNQDSYKNNNIYLIDGPRENNRWSLNLISDLDLGNNYFVDIDINKDSDYLYKRDYDNNFIGSNESKITISKFYDNKKESSFANIDLSLLNFQELEFGHIKGKDDLKTLPKIDISHYKYADNYNHKLELSSSNLYLNHSKYHRLSPKFDFNFFNNISSLQINFNPSLLSNFYYIDNFDQSDAYYANNTILTNNLSISLPLYSNKIFKNQSIYIEPIVNVIKSNSLRRDNISNLDSNDNILTINNLLLSDRIYGFDRYEISDRVNYLLQASFLSNKYNDIIIALGQSRKLSNDNDTDIYGYNNSNMSNIIGKISFLNNDFFNLTYKFQLDQESYESIFNNIVTNFRYKRASANIEYLDIKKQNNSFLGRNGREQISYNVNMPLTRKLNIGYNSIYDLLVKDIISDKFSINYNGCCIMYNFAVNRRNFRNLAEEDISYNFNILIKNL